jgi:hypothetical protein
MGQIVSPALVAETTAAGGWQLASPSASGWLLDPTAGGGVLLMVFMGLSCGIAWACRGGGKTRALGAIGLGFGLGVVVAGTEWLVCVLWASRGSQAPVEAWASGSVHLWALLIVVMVTVTAAVARLLISRPRDSRPSAAQGSTARAIGRLMKAVPQAGRATYAVCAVSAVLTVLTVRAASPSTYDTMSRTITGVVQAIWP